MKCALFGVLTVAALSVAPGPQTFTGIIADDVCGTAGHAHMQMGPTDAECTRACIAAHGASYVLLDEKTVYTLNDQQTPARFAAQTVKVLGTLDAKTKTIKVESIVLAR